jgi:hypothetical protein
VERTESRREIWVTLGLLRESPSVCVVKRRRKRSNNISSRESEETEGRLGDVREGLVSVAVRLFEGFNGRSGRFERRGWEDGKRKEGRRRKGRRNEQSSCTFRSGGRTRDAERITTSAIDLPAAKEGGARSAREGFVRKIEKSEIKMTGRERTERQITQRRTPSIALPLRKSHCHRHRLWRELEGAMGGTRWRGGRGPASMAIRWRE